MKFIFAKLFESKNGTVAKHGSSVSLSKKCIAFMQIDEKRFYDLIVKMKAPHSYLVGAKRSSLCSSRLFAEYSCSEHKG